MKCEHNLLVIHPVVQAVIRIIVIRDNEVGISFPKGSKAWTLFECLHEEVVVASGRIGGADADEFSVTHGNLLSA